MMIWLHEDTSSDKLRIKRSAFLFVGTLRVLFKSYEEHGGYTAQLGAHITVFNYFL